MKRFIVSFAIFSLLGIHLYGGLMEYQRLDDNGSLQTPLHIQTSPDAKKLLEQWLANFTLLYPNLKSLLHITSSKKSIKALKKGRINIALSNRKIMQKEIDRFINKKGYQPTEIVVALNALVIYVNRANKLASLTLPQLDAIFSTSLHHGYPHSITNWKELTGMESNINIYLYDKNTSIYQYFQQGIMQNGTFNTKRVVHNHYKEFAQLAQALANDSHAIGFGSISNKNHQLKALRLTQKAYFPLFEPNRDNIISTHYPLTQFYYLYLDIPSNQKIEPSIYEFCKYILSQEGQKIVEEWGGFALSPKQVGFELSKIRR